MQPPYLFRTAARWVRNRRGTVQPATLSAALDFSSPPEFQGEAGLWTPEDLLTSAVATCFIATFRAIAEYSKFEAPALTVDVEGTVDKPDTFRFTHIVIRPRLTVASEEDREKGQRLLEKTERACLVSRSLNSEIRMEPVVTVAGETAGA